MLVIVLNVLVLMLDSVADIHRPHGRLLSIVFIAVEHPK